jgi:hypothetical protein
MIVLMIWWLNLQVVLFINVSLKATSAAYKKNGKHAVRQYCEATFFVFGFGPLSNLCVAASP